MAPTSCSIAPESLPLLGAVGAQADGHAYFSRQFKEDFNTIMRPFPAKERSGATDHHRGHSAGARENTRYFDGCEATLLQVAEMQS